MYTDYTEFLTDSLKLSEAAKAAMGADPTLEEIYAKKLHFYLILTILKCYYTLSLLTVCCKQYFKALENLWLQDVFNALKFVTQISPLLNYYYFDNFVWSCFQLCKIIFDYLF